MNIAVKKSYRNQKIGTELMKQIIEISKKFDVEKIGLEVSQNNIYAIKLYENMGFKQVGIRKDYYGENNSAIIMDYYYKKI